MQSLHALVGNFCNFSLALEILSACNAFSEILLWGEGQSQHCLHMWVVWILPVPLWDALRAESGLGFSISSSPLSRDTVSMTIFDVTHFSWPFLSCILTYYNTLQILCIKMQRTECFVRAHIRLMPVLAPFFWPALIIFPCHWSSL